MTTGAEQLARLDSLGLFSPCKLVSVHQHLEHHPWVGR